MAMRAYVYGVKAVVKESAGKQYLSRAVPWTDSPEKRPEKVVERNKKFTDAVAMCERESKYKGGNVWGVSNYNKCIAKALKKVV